MPSASAAREGKQRTASGNGEVVELAKVPGDGEEAELEKVPGDGKEHEIEEKFSTASIESKEHEEACWFWRGGFRGDANSFDETARRSGLRMSDLVLHLMIDAWVHNKIWRRAAGDRRGHGSGSSARRVSLRAASDSRCAPPPGWPGGPRAARTRGA